MTRHTYLFLSLFLSCTLGTQLSAQQPTTFRRMGTADEAVQEFFPGEHRARPVLAAYTNNGHMGLFSGGQDLGGSTGWQDDTRWGDLGDGTFANPILNGDYSDPDVIRVGQKYYMTCSEFHFVGMPILESDDMVNWRIIAQVYPQIDLPGYDSMTRYGEGTWAPAIRYHAGQFWIFVCMPNDGLFMSHATSPAGPWSPLHCVRAVKGWEDPCPFWDEDGQAYVGRSQLGAGPIILHKMAPDGTRLLDDGVKIYEGEVAEGTKLFKKDGYYYLSIPEGGVGTGWQTVMRSKNIYGPYEKRRVLEMGATRVNGPHQGALVDTPDGEWWFYHFQSTTPQGRVVHLLPVVWQDGFPTIGTDYDKNGVGEPMKVCRKPATGVHSAPFAPQSDDDFASGVLAPQWQFNHNPDDAHWSLTRRAGSLGIEAMQATTLRMARNQFTQKTMGYRGEVHVALHYADMAPSQRAGIECIGSRFCGMGILMRTVGDACVPMLYLEIDGTPQLYDLPTGLSDSTLYLRLTIDALTNRHQFYWSTDQETYTACGEPFDEDTKDWKGSRVGLYSYTTRDGASGWAYFDHFTYHFDGPGALK